MTVQYNSYDSSPLKGRIRSKGYAFNRIWGRVAILLFMDKDFMYDGDTDIFRSDLATYAAVKGRYFPDKPENLTLGVVHMKRVRALPPIEPYWHAIQPWDYGAPGWDNVFDGPTKLFERELVELTPSQGEMANIFNKITGLDSAMAGKFIDVLLLILPNEGTVNGTLQPVVNEFKTAMRLTYGRFMQWQDFGIVTKERWLKRASSAMDDFARWEP